jgi:hypothetical protein
MNEQCAACGQAANEDEGELISVLGTVANSPSPEPVIQRVHRGCRKWVNEPESTTERDDVTGNGR